MPDGWRLVPVEPTPKQIGDGIRALMDAPDLGGIVEPYLPEVVDAYKAMLTSAPPAPPSPSVGGAVDERAAFEAWAERTGRHLHKVTPCDGSKPQYLDACALMAWEAWQARAALAREGGA